MPRICLDAERTVLRISSPNMIVGIMFFAGSSLMFLGYLANLIFADTIKVNDRTLATSDPTAWFPLMFFGFFPLLGLLVWILSYKSTFILDRAGIKQFNLGRLKSEMTWSGVIDLTTLGHVPKFGIISRLQGLPSDLVLVSNQSKMQLPMNRTNWPVVAAHIQYHLPQLHWPIGKPAKEVQTSRPTVSSDGYVIRQGVLLIGGIILVTVGGLVGCALLGSQDLHTVPFMLLLILPLAFFFGGLIAITAAINCKTVITDSSISKYSLRGSIRDEIHWSDVKAFEYETTFTNKGGTTSYYVLRTQDAYIRFNTQEPKWLEMSQLIIGLLPPDARIYMPSAQIS